MAGYSGKSLTQKLGIKPGFCIFVSGAPAAYGDIVGTLPDGATLATRFKAPLSSVPQAMLCFARESGECVHGC